LKCEVCGAPSIPFLGACAFCRSPLESDPDIQGLLDYLAARLPEARVQRALWGLSGRREVELTAGRIRYRAMEGAGEVRLRPEAPPAEWVDHLLRDLSGEAARNAGLRAAMTRAGWALR
jgi:hypothetical protein